VLPLNLPASPGNATQQDHLVGYPGSETVGHDKEPTASWTPTYRHPLAHGATARGGPIAGVRRVGDGPRTRIGDETVGSPFEVPAHYQLGFLRPLALAPAPTSVDPGPFPHNHVSDSKADLEAGCCSVFHEEGIVNIHRLVVEYSSLFDIRYSRVLSPLPRAVSRLPRSTSPEKPVRRRSCRARQGSAWPRPDSDDTGPVVLRVPPATAHPCTERGRCEKENSTPGRAEWPPTSGRRDKDR